MKNKKIIYITVGILVAGALLFNAYKYYYQQRRIEENKRATSETKETIKNGVGGTILGNGFEISYLSDKDVFYLNITASPFETYKNDALEKLKSFGISLCSINYFVSPGRGVIGEEIYSTKSCE